MNSSKKALLAAFKEATFDPRKPGSMATICSTNDVTYLLARAEEALRDSKAFHGVERRARVRSAISILAYAMTLIPTSSVEPDQVRV